MPTSDSFSRLMGPTRNYIFGYTEDGQFSVTKIYPPSPYRLRDFVALDAEMVGVGPDGLESALARISMVNWECQVLFHTYVKVDQPVTDFRSFVSGIRPEQIEGESAMTLEHVRKVVSSILYGKILIGHGLDNDLKTIGIYHPLEDIRDSATFIPFMKQQQRFMGGTEVLGEPVLCPRKLKDLALEKLGRHIQTLGKPHSPVEDAIASMDLYKASCYEWESAIVKKNRDVSLGLSEPLMHPHCTRMYAPLPPTTLSSKSLHHHQSYHTPLVMPPPYSPHHDAHMLSSLSDYNSIDTSYLYSHNQSYAQNYRVQQQYYHKNAPLNYHPNVNNEHGIHMDHLLKRQPIIFSTLPCSKETKGSSHLIKVAKRRNKSITNTAQKNPYTHTRRSQKRQLFV